eukprot:m.720305 g.720305  ORF g.720305 m.720305 type:complete len:51 (-) comp58818_c0_seq10:1966-2118(-)
MLAFSPHMPSLQASSGKSFFISFLNLLIEHSSELSKCPQEDQNLQKVGSE